MVFKIVSIIPKLKIIHFKFFLKFLDRGGHVPLCPPPLDPPLRTFVLFTKFILSLRIFFVFKCVFLNCVVRYTLCFKNDNCCTH